MGLLEGDGAKVGSLVGAAMETAGTALQSDFLDFINGTEGQLIAGLLYLIAVVTGVLTVAIGGNYKWARYLLVGPPLFFFLTQVRIASNGADWVFGTDEFPKDARERALKGVNKFNAGEGGGNDVAMVFQLWNVFMSDVTHTLVQQLKRDQQDRHFNFVNKVDRYMRMWNHSHINDQDLRLLIHQVMAPQCARYFKDKTILASDHSNPGAKEDAAERLKEMEEVTVEHYFRAANNNWAAMIEKDLVEEGPMTCDQLWQKTVAFMRLRLKDDIPITVGQESAIGQDPRTQLVLYLQKFTTSTDRGTGQVAMEDVTGSDNFDEKLREAVDWVIARSLFLEIGNDNPFLNTFEFDGKKRTVGSGMGSGTESTGDLTDATDEMSQFNKTDKFQHRGDYLNAAMSLPHFQGVMLFLLAASYPFFCLMVIVPGRAGSVLVWFGLWAWVKLWDLGFAVVMMIDDILYAMFPRAPSFADGADGKGGVMDPGEAWTRIMELDPNYSATMYYNLIATCMYAVPLACGFFVKGGASELVNLMHGSWSTQSGRLAGSAATFARALQAQGYAKIRSEEIFDAAMKGRQTALRSEEMRRVEGELDDTNQILALLNNKVGSQLGNEAVQRFLGGLESRGVVGKGFGKSLMEKGEAQVAAYLQERVNQLRAAKYAMPILAAQRAAWDYNNSARGFWLSERAVAARFSNHHFNMPHYGKYQMQYETRRIMGTDAVQAFKARYDDIQTQLKNKDLDPTARAALEVERDSLEFTAKNSWGGGANVLTYDMNSLLGNLGDSGLKTLQQNAASAAAGGTEDRN